MRKLWEQRLATKKLLGGGRQGRNDKTHKIKKKKTTQNLEDRNPIVTEVGKFDKKNLILIKRQTSKRIKLITTPCKSQVLRVKVCVLQSACPESTHRHQEQAFPPAVSLPEASLCTTDQSADRVHLELRAAS